MNTQANEAIAADLRAKFDRLDAARTLFATRTADLERARNEFHAAVADITPDERAMWAAQP